MLDKETEIEFSKLLSFILRHEPAFAYLNPDEAGWVTVDELMEGLKKKQKPLSREDLEQIVRNSDKQRFALSPDGKRIRSNQGHSISVELGYEPGTPPDFLYHGTAKRFVESIGNEGLTKRSRHHVHLSISVETASKVGKRHGKLVLLKIHASKMHRDGFQFFLSTNGVWLTERVPVEYIIFPETTEL